MDRKNFANAAIFGLVALEVGMGLASTNPNMPDWAVTALLFAVLAVGSVLQACMLTITLRHMKHKNWRWKPAAAIQAALFLMIAWWAHKGLGNTIFQGVNEYLLYLAGMGLGLLTMFGPEVVNYDDYDEQPDDQPEAEKPPAMTIQSDFAARPTQGYQVFQTPLEAEKNGHSVDLEEAAHIVEH